MQANKVKFFTLMYLIEIFLLSRYGIGMKSSEISMAQTVDLMKVLSLHSFNKPANYCSLVSGHACH
jgi:hypothetical protein